MACFHRLPLIYFAFLFSFSFFIFFVVFFFQDIMLKNQLTFIAKKHFIKFEKHKEKKVKYFYSFKFISL